MSVCPSVYGLLFLVFGFWFLVFDGAFDDLHLKLSTRQCFVFPLAYPSPLLLDFPAVEYARAAMKANQIGEITSVSADFHFNSTISDEYPSSPLYNAKLGGGAAMYVAPYPISAVLSCFSGFPKRVVSVGVVDAETGVDLSGSMSMMFTQPAAKRQSQVAASSPRRLDPRGAAVASIQFGFCGESQEETVIVGTRGRIKIHSPAHCPTKVSVSSYVPEKRLEVEEESFTFDLPEDTDQIKESGGWNYPNSAGLAYEAAAIARCIKQGLRESPQYTIQESLWVLRIIDMYREQCGIATICVEEVRTNEVDEGEEVKGGRGKDCEVKSE